MSFKKGHHDTVNKRHLKASIINQNKHFLKLSHNLIAHII